MNSQPAERAPQTQQSKQNERQIELHHREWLEAFAGLLAWGLPGAPSSGRWMNWGAQGHSRVCFAERWLMLPLSSREPLPLPPQLRPSAMIPPCQDPANRWVSSPMAAALGFRRSLRLATEILAPLGIGCGRARRMAATQMPWRAIREPRGP